METNSGSFKVLSSRLYKLFEKEAYSESTVRDMDFILQAMASYMEAVGLEEYTPEVGERFVTHCINDLRICSSHVSRAKNIVGKLNRLLQGRDGRDVLIPDLSKRLRLPDGLMSPLIRVSRQLC